MRHTILALLVIAAVLIGWRIRTHHAAGEALHAKEIAARAMAERILRAERERRRNVPPGARIGPYEYLGTLVAEGRVAGLTPLASPDRELFVAGDYVFHVRLLNRLGRPLARPPADPASEPGLGRDFELWAWPADPQDTVLALFFASDAGYLLQGDNGVLAGPDARPEDVESNPLREVDPSRSPTGASDQWIPLLHVEDA